ncbi:MAG: NHLP family bacteriocin export ABC transporter peptidase/permease/ATPase subunit, partial [Janthinobacterium lividum]
MTRLADPFARRPRRTPTVLQNDAVECGPASLAIVLAHYGNAVALEQLRLDCGVSRDGSTAANVLHAARAHGLLASGRKLDIDALHEEPVPLILFWQFNHFLVLEGLRGRWVYLNDPACGPRRISRDTFDRGYTGVALCCQPGPDFQPQSRQTRPVAVLEPVLASLVLIFIASLALALPTLAIPVFARVFVDGVLIERLDGWVKPLLLGMALTAVLRSALTWIQQQALLRLELRLAMAWSARFFWHVLRLPVPYFQQRHAADVLQRVGANDRVAQLLCGNLATDSMTLLTMVLTLLIMLSYDVTMTLIGVALTMVNVLALQGVARLRADASLQWQTDHGMLMAWLIGALRSIETIKAGGAEADFFQRWSGQQAKVANINLRLDGITNMLAALPFLVSALITVSILWLGGLRVMAGDMTVGMLVGFQSLMLAFSAPVKNLMGIAGNFQEARANLRRIADVLRAPLDLRFCTAGANPANPGNPASGANLANLANPADLTGLDPDGHPRLQGWLEVRDLCFGYNRLAAPLVAGFNLRLAPGQRVALVGTSGCGKSTVAKLIMGEMAPWSGQILFDGMPREAIPAAVMHASLAGVDQEIHMFDGSVRDNLTLWDHSLPEADMVRAAQDALIHDAITGRALAYDALLDEDAMNFSGGQRQRLEIARALCINPRTLVLDEATSALDAVLEQEIDDNLRRRGCSCLIIAHRLSTIRDCDEIIVMAGGRVAERGTHEQLLK